MADRPTAQVRAACAGRWRGFGSVYQRKPERRSEVNSREQVKPKATERSSKRSDGADGEHERTAYVSEAKTRKADDVDVPTLRRRTERVGWVPERGVLER